MNKRSPATSALFLMVLIAPLTGCVVGQHLQLDSTPPDVQPVGQGQPVFLQVEDQREEVTSGKKPPWYIGIYRAGLGNPWNVTTEDNVPLADQLEKDLDEELVSMGFTSGSDGHHLQVFIKEWSFTGYQNGRFWYALDIMTLNHERQVLATDLLEDEIAIKGTFMLGARGGFERDMPGIYEGIIRKVIRNNPKVLQSLQE